MEMIKTIAINICIVMIITGIFSVLVPSKNFEKILSFAISLFFVCSIAIPLIRGELKFDFTPQNEYLSSFENDLDMSMDDSVKSLAQNNLTSVIDELLRQNDIIAKKIDVSINITEDDSININNVKIHISENDEIFELKIKEIILREVGITPEIKRE